MNLQNNSTYFYLYAQGQTLGPMSHEAIIDELESERLGQDAYLWNNQLESWQSIKDCPDFKNWTHYLPKTTLIENIQSEAENSKTIHSDSPYYLKSHDFIENFENTSLRLPEKLLDTVHAQTLFKYKIPLLIGALGIVILSITANFYLNPTLPELNPSLRQTNLSEEQIRELAQQIYYKKLTAPRILKSIESSTTDTLLIVTPYPNGSRLKIKLSGKRGSLVGALHEELQLRASTYQFVAQTPMLRTNANLPLPDGTYVAQIECLNCVNSAPYTTTLRLGTLSEPIYQNNLLEFHKIIKSQAESEIVELKEILNLLNEIGPGVTSKKMKRFATQLEDIFKSLDEKTIKNYYVYYPIYLKIKSLYNQKESKTFQQWSLDVQYIETLRSTHEKDLKVNGLDFNKIEAI